MNYSGKDNLMDIQQKFRNEWNRFLRGMNRIIFLGLFACFVAWQVEIPGADAGLCLGVSIFIYGIYWVLRSPMCPKCRDRITISRYLNKPKACTYCHVSFLGK